MGYVISKQSTVAIRAMNDFLRFAPELGVLYQA
jgi:hypothetical protein